MKFVLSITFFFLSVSLLKAQTERKDFYPVPKTLKAEGNAGFKDFQQLMAFSDCVSGDCVNGDGVWIEMQVEKSASVVNGKSRLGYKDYSYFYGTLLVSVGKFSNNGEILTGKQYGIPIGFEVKDGSKQLKPTREIDLSDQKAIANFLIFEGELIKGQDKNKFVFFRKEGRDIFSEYYNKKYKNYYAYYIYGKEQFVDIAYHKQATDTVSRFKGALDRNQSYRFGQTYNNDKLVYEGFFLDEKYHGPGKLYVNGKVQSGMWKKGELFIDMPFDFPKGSFDFNERKQYTKNFNLTLDGKITSGKITASAGNGNELFFSDDRKYFYFGKILNRMPQGLGFLFNVLEGGYSYAAANYIDNIWLWFGNFEKGQLVDGTFSNYVYHVPVNGKAKGFLNYSLEKTGTFVNKQLTGCGSYTVFAKGEGTSYTEGNFNKDNIYGWHYFKSNTQRYAHNGITHPSLRNVKSATIFDELQKSIIVECNVATPEQITSLIVEKKKAYLEAQAKLQAQQIYAQRQAALKAEECNTAYDNVGYVFYKSGRTLYVNGFDCKSGFYNAIDGDNAPVKKIVVSFNELKTYEKRNTRHGRMFCEQCEGMGGYLAMKTTDKWGYRGGYDVNVRVRTITTKMEGTKCSKCNGRGWN